MNAKNKTEAHGALARACGCLQCYAMLEVIAHHAARCDGRPCDCGNCQAALYTIECHAIGVLANQVIAREGGFRGPEARA